ncbi:hypothetical protein ACJMK2_029203 [Sinanodonta woodiana]|uniref:Uncharacterized protein n=1 Tax=Sinanodonta woodiana TaxID=1069815 RepID=A0ABD3XBA0_SINWO
MIDLDLHFFYIPRIWKTNGESEIFRRIHMFLKLASMLVYFRPAHIGPTFTYTRQRVLYQLMKLKPCVVPEVQQLLDIMQEAALAYTINKAELETATRAPDELFSKEQLEKWYSRKLELKSYIKEHKAVIKKILKLQKHFSTRYDTNQTLWETIDKISDEESPRMSRREKKLLRYKHAVLQETMLLSNIYSESCSLRAEIEAALQNKLTEGISNLKLVAGYKCPEIDIAEVCARTYAATSKRYSYVDTNMPDLYVNYGFLPEVIRTRVETSELVKLTKEDKKNPRSRSVVLPKKIYVTYWGQILDPKERGKFTCERPVKQKIISTDAGKGFGWTRRSIFSSKEWIIYYLERAPNPDLL